MFAPQSNRAETGPNWYDEDIYDLKSLHFKSVLGEPHQTMLGALLGWDVGGPVDLWIYLNHIDATVFTTMQLVVPGSKEQKHNTLGMYELAAATRHFPNPVDEGNPPKERTNDTPYDKASLEIRSMLTMMARYSGMRALNPNETAEIPSDDPGEEATYMIFDTLIGNEHHLELSGEPYGILLVTRVFKSEIDYARKNGTQLLIEKLKAANVYPLSDLDREPVI
tara:strand:+ start:388 stop:1056 length:669 start_codon:yes stop_codon:yes gene_type:complete